MLDLPAARKVYHNEVTQWIDSCHDLQMPRFALALLAFFTGTSRAWGLVLTCPVHISLVYIESATFSRAYTSPRDSSHW